MNVLACSDMKNVFYAWAEVVSNFYSNEKNTVKLWVWQ